MAEWLGRGLQNLVQRFESASDLTATRDGSIFFAVFSPTATSCVLFYTANMATMTLRHLLNYQAPSHNKETSSA